MDRGEDPKAGMRMKLDPKAKEITIYDAASKGFKKINLYPDRSEGEGGQRRSAGKREEIPCGGPDKKTITIYSGRQKLLTTFSVPDEYLELPDNTWEAGDEVRIYYKEPGKA